MQHRIIGIAVFALVAATSADAQQGVADLQYRAPTPASVTYTSVDSTRTRMSGMPTGDMTSTARYRSVTEVSFAPTDSGFQATVSVIELQGSTSTPMGDVPTSASNLPPMTLMITARGPRPDELAQNTPATGASTDDIMAAAKAVSGLLLLPGRELALGESWTDTISVSPEITGFETEMLTVAQGTYVSDTIVDGVTLNVLRIVSEVRMTMSGTVQGMAMTQTMTTTGEERVLWDSARHYLVLRDGTGTIRTETRVSDMGMTMVMTGETHSVTTSHVQE